MSFTDILRDREEGEGWSNCSSRLPSHLTLGSSMALTSPQVRARFPSLVTKSHKKSQKVTKSNKKSQKVTKVTTNLLQPTTPLSLFLNTTETSATPVQRSVTPLLFPEHRLQSPVTPGWCRKVKMTPECISLWVVWHLFHRAPQKQWQIPLIKSPSSLSVKYSIRLDLDLYHPLSTSSRNYSCCWNLFTWEGHQLIINSTLLMLMWMMVSQFCSQVQSFCERSPH